MFFVLQKENKNLDLEICIVKEKLDSLKYIHEYTFMSYEELFYDENIENEINSNNDNCDYKPKVKKLLTATNFPEYMKDAIPIGSVNFISAWLKIFHNVENLYPIEIPKILRTNEFLKREYKIVTANELPRKGKYFIKDVSKLKSFSSLVYDDLLYLPIDEMLKTPQEIEDIKKKPNDNSLYLDNTHMYSLSERVNILSEYRVYIIDGEIQSIAHYNGNPCILPDVELIKKANMIYSFEKNYPKSLTIDIMVTPKGTSIIEIHPFAAIGLYNSLWGDNLLYAYRDGIDYYIKHNNKIEI